MPKINVTHKLERIQKRIAQLENDEALEARDINALLTPEQQQELKDAWVIQQQLRKNHKPPKTDAEKNKLGWKTIREVRLGVYRNALACLDNNIVAEMKTLAKQSETKAAKVFMAGWSKAIDNGKSGLSAISAGNIALSRAGFAVGNSVATKRDRELWAMEDALLKQFENELSNEEKEQLEIVREHEKSQKKRK